jgi:hypothetical protein
MEKLHTVKLTRKQILILERILDERLTHVEIDLDEVDDTNYLHELFYNKGFENK